MMTPVQHIHSFLRYPIVLLLIATLFFVWQSLKSEKKFTTLIDKLSLWSMIMVHTQMLLGLVLYILSPKVLFSEFSIAMKDSMFRFFTIEHILGMFIAIALITIGRVRLKRIVEPSFKLKNILWFYGLGLMVLFFSIPWPFIKNFGTWF